MNLSALIRRTIVVLAAGSAAACATALQPTDHTAVVRAGQWGKVYRGGYVEVASITGIEPSWRLRSEIEVRAGDRIGVFYVYLCKDDAKQCYSISQAQFSFQAEAGRIYRARAREQTNGTNRFWVWVEDQATGKVVGGIPPDGLVSDEK